jgi:3-oxoacyl-[acyl-carrier-protein] synthase-3
MGSVIEACSVAPGRTGHAGAQRLADQAAESCLAEAGVAASDVDLLINCGIYHDRLMGEPALAALIQEDIGANPGHPPVGGHGTFSFDLANGPCGVLNAMEVIDGFLSAGTARFGLVVTSDAHPGHGLAVDFPYAPVAGAALLRSDGARDGLVAMRTDTYPAFERSYQARVHWEPHRRRLRRRHARGRNVLVIDEEPDFATRRVECAGETVSHFLRDTRAGSVDLVATNETGENVAALADQLGLPFDTFVAPAAELGRAHTAGLLVAMAEARARGRWHDAETILLAATGPGITVGCALYRPR